MRPLSREELEQTCQGVGVALAEDTAAGIGLVPQFHQGPRRVVRLQLGEPGRDLAHKMASLVLGLCDDWILVPRFRGSSGLGFANPGTNAAATLFTGSEVASLAQHLSAFKHPEAIYSDLWLLSADGCILIRWSHHAHVDGLDIEFASVPEASQLLVALNECGAEFGVLSNDP